MGYQSRSQKICSKILYLVDISQLVFPYFNFVSILSCYQVKLEGKTSFLTPVCMNCLEGWTASIVCKFCFKPWTGGHLILGTMYSYDIFAAVPCCPERLKVIHKLYYTYSRLKMEKIVLQ